MAGLGDGGGVHPAALHGDSQRLAGRDHAVFDAGRRVVGGGGHGDGDAGGGVLGVAGDLHLAHKGDGGDGGVVVQRAVGPDAGVGLAPGVQLHLAHGGAHLAGGVDEGQDVVVHHGHGQRAHGLDGGHVLIRVGLGHAFVEDAAQGVAAGDLAHRPGGGAGGAGAQAEHRLGEADHRAQRLLLGGLLGKGGVAGLVHIGADGRGDGIGLVADEAVGLGADGAGVADHRGGAVRHVAVVAHIDAGAAHGDAHRHKHAALGFHPGDVGGAGDAHGLGDHAAAGVQQHVAAGGDGGGAGNGGLGLGGGDGAGQGRQHLGEAALVHRADVHLAVGAEHGARAAGELRVALHHHAGLRLAPGKGQGDVAEQLGAVEVHQGGRQRVNVAGVGGDIALDQDLDGGLFDDDEVGDGVGGHGVVAHEHIPHGLGLPDGGGDVHRAGGGKAGVLAQGDGHHGGGVIQADAVFQLGLGEFVFRHGDGELLAAQHVRVLGRGQDEDVLAGHLAQDLHFRGGQDHREAAGQQLFHHDALVGLHQQVGHVVAAAQHQGGEVMVHRDVVHVGVQGEGGDHIVGEILALGGRGEFVQQKGALVLQPVGDGVEAGAEADVDLLLERHRVGDVLDDIAQIAGEGGQDLRHALGHQVQAVVGLADAVFKGDGGQHGAVVPDVLHGQAAGEVQAVVAAVLLFADGHVQAENVVERAGGVQADHVVARAAGDGVPAAVGLGLFL